MAVGGGLAKENDESGHTPLNRDTPCPRREIPIYTNSRHVSSRGNSRESRVGCGMRVEGSLRMDLMLR
ncbi:hypothetical protein VI817_000355 [Penicillium citrinum]|nr:hypothetical protein VI817_000355 [Penicillium citrinum]